MHFGGNCVVATRDAGRCLVRSASGHRPENRSGVRAEPSLSNQWVQT